MNDDRQDDRQERRYWLDEPRNVTRIVYGLAVLCALVFAADLFYDKHPHFTFEGWFGFYAIYGFAGSVALVLSAKWMRRFLRRDEDHYERRDGAADD